MATPDSAAGSTRDSSATRTSRPVALATRAEKLVAAAVEDRHRVADAEPQHAGEVLPLVARQRDDLVARIHRRREEPMHCGKL